MGDCGLRIRRPPFESAIRNPQSAIAGWRPAARLSCSARRRPAARLYSHRHPRSRRRHRRPPPDRARAGARARRTERLARRPGSGRTRRALARRRAGAAAGRDDVGRARRHRADGRLAPRVSGLTRDRGATGSDGVRGRRARQRARRARGELRPVAARGRGAGGGGVRPLGAAVNLVTRRGASPAARELEASAGSWGRYELKARAGARHGAWDYYVGARYEREGGWREDTRSRIGTLFAKLGLLNGTWDATLSYTSADNKIFQAGSLPESVAAANPRRNFTGGDYFAPRAHLVILNAQRLIGRTQLAINAFGRSLSSEQFNANFVGEDSRQRNATRIGGGAAQLSGKLPLGRRELRWLAGADADYEHVAVRIFAVPAGGRASPDSLTESVRTNQVNAGAFAGANLEVVPRLTATVAARYDWIRVPFEDLIDSTQSGLHVFRRLSPRGGLTWSGRRGHEVFASVSRGFRAPAIVELACADPQAACPLPFALGPDPALQPVVATTYELGWRVRASGGRVDASADVYRTDVRDDIFFIASTVTGGYFHNIGATRRRGVELALQGLGPAGARAYANYGYTRATFETTATLATTRDTAGETVRPGDELPMVPRHRVNAGLAVPILRHQGKETGVALAAAVDARYVGRQWLRGDEENVTRRLSDYTIADLSLTLTWRDFELRGAVRNLFDRRVYTFGTFAENPTAPGSPVQRWLTPAPPRHVQISLSTDF